MMDNLDLLVSLETEVKRERLERGVFLVPLDNLVYKDQEDLQETLVQLELQVHLEPMD